MILSSDVFDAAMDEIRQRSKKALYQRDFAAWQWDVLGERTYQKMQAIGEDALFTPKRRTLIKSGNGSAKTFQAARWAMWWITAFPPEESLAIITAPTLRQVEGGVIQYAKSCWGYVKQSALNDGRPMPWPGWVTEQNEWKYSALGGNQSLMVGRVPAPTDAVSTLQGLRKIGGRNLVLLDEAGGVAEEIYTAIEALMTGGDSRMAGIGNPDRRATPMWEKFSMANAAKEYELHTISCYDLPTMTGEIVYPDDPDKQALMLKGLTSADWICQKERVWKTGGEIFYDEKLGFERNLTGKPDARFKAKVLGEFPDEDDRAFFSESIIVKSFENDIDPGIDAPVLGVDLAAEGDDESVVYVNRNGNIRLFDQTIRYQDGDEERETTGIWAKEDEVTSARRVHAIAKYTGAREVRLDAAGLGHGIAVALERYDEFSDGNYDVIQVIGSNQSSDRDAWANNRAENHDALRYQMRDGTIDLDPADTILRDQLLTVTYELNNRGAVQITPKKDMRSGMHGSPDRLDACIYAALDTSPLTSNPLGGMEKGDMVTRSAWDMLQESRDPAFGYPL